MGYASCGEANSFKLAQLGLLVTGLANRTTI